MSPETPQNVVLDAIAALMALDRDDTGTASLMLASYAAMGEPMTLVAGMVAVSVAAVRYAALVRGLPAEQLLASMAQQVRAQS
jgi:hypothetical protein